MDTVTISKAEYDRLKTLETQVLDADEAERALQAFLRTRRRFDWRQAWNEVRQERRRAG